MNENDGIWSGSPSQLVNFNYFFSTIAVIVVGLYLVFFPPSMIMRFHSLLANICFAGMIIALFFSCLRYFSTMLTVFTLTESELIITSGILSRSGERLELYRIRDYSLYQPFFLRILSGGKLGNLILISSDRTHPRVYLEGIKNGETILNDIRTQVEKCREQKGVREIDVE
jgi:hypothetical protein